jgi:DNA N-6-adenine-methyltransferase (Dam)
MTLGSHQRSIGKSHNHISPQRIADPFQPIGLDPCAANPRPWGIARINWTSGSLERDWLRYRHLFIYENPPFDRNEVARWVLKLAEHGNGIALLHARTETEWFQIVWQYASAILFMSDRIKFRKPDGTEQPHNSGAPPVLVAFGDEAVLRLRRCGIAGTLVTDWRIQPASSPPQQSPSRIELVAGAVEERRMP